MVSWPYYLYNRNVYTWKYLILLLILYKCYNYAIMCECDFVCADNIWLLYVFYNRSSKLDIYLIWNYPGTVFAFLWVTLDLMHTDQVGSWCKQTLFLLWEQCSKYLLLFTSHQLCWTSCVHLAEHSEPYDGCLVFYFSKHDGCVCGHCLNLHLLLIFKKESLYIFIEINLENHVEIDQNHRLSHIIHRVLDQHQFM